MLRNHPWILPCGCSLIANAFDEVFINSFLDFYNSCGSFFPTAILWVLPPIKPYPNPTIFTPGPKPSCVTFNTTHVHCMILSLICSVPQGLHIWVKSKVLWWLTRPYNLPVPNTSSLFLSPCLFSFTNMFPCFCFCFFSNHIRIIPGSRLFLPPLPLFGRLFTLISWPCFALIFWILLKYYFSKCFSKHPTEK